MRGLWAAAICLALASAPAAAEWKYESHSDNVDSDDPFAMAFVKGETGQLAIRCDEPGVDSVYVWFQYYDLLYPEGADQTDAPVTVKLDDTRTITDQWTFYDFNGVLIDREPVWTLMNALKGARCLTMSTIDSDGKQIDVDLDVAGAAASINRVITACRAKSPG